MRNGGSDGGVIRRQRKKEGFPQEKVCLSVQEEAAGGGGGQGAFAEPDHPGRFLLSVGGGGDPQTHQSQRRVALVSSSSSGDKAEPGGPPAGQEGVGGGGESNADAHLQPRSCPACALNLCVCVCFQEAKAIIAQRSDNPREFFKKKERAMASSVDASPVSMHRTGKETAGRKERGMM